MSLGLEKAGSLVKRVTEGSFALRISTGQRKINEPSTEVRQFAEEQFGSYEAYIDKIRRFISEDAAKLLDILGPGPLLYYNTMSKALVHFLTSYRQNMIEEQQREKTKHSRQSKMSSLCLPIEESHDAPIQVVGYTPAAEFYLDETCFSMRLCSSWMALLLLHEDGKIIYEKNSATDYGHNRFGNLADDPILYQSLVQLVSSDPDLQVVEFRSSKALVRFLKPQHRISREVEQYIRAHHPHLLQAPQETPQ